MTWQPGPGDSDGAQPPAWPYYAADELPGDTALPAEAARPGASRRRRGTGWTAMVLLLGLGLCGLAAAAVGVAHQLLPRQFSLAQARQIETWEMTGRWRALSAGQIFPASVTYTLPATAVNSAQSLPLAARRLAISPAIGCASAVSAAAAKVLAAAHCSAVMRATYVDSSGSMVATVGVAVLPDSQAAQTAARALAAHGLALTVRALPVPGTVARGFGDAQRQLAAVEQAGPYVILSTAGFTDGRPHVRLASDFYYDQEMGSLADGLALSAGALLGTGPVIPKCPGAPGC